MKIAEMLENRKAPSGEILLRSIINLIPACGSSIDVLLFSHAQEHRIKNLQKAIEAYDLRLTELKESSLNKEWFFSVEGLALFRELINRVQFEPDDKKITALARVFVTAGTKDLSEDNRKLSIYDHIGRLSYVQMKLLKIISTIKPQQKKAGKGGISQNLSGIWYSQIDEVLSKDNNQFWDGKMDLNLELEILEAHNMIKCFASFVSNDFTFELTALGKAASNYLKEL